MKKHLIIIIPILLFSCNKKINTEYSINIKEGLRIRESKNTDSKILGVIPYNNKIQITELDLEQTRINNILGNWCKIKWNNIQGWVFNPYIKLNNNIYVGKYELIYENEKPILNLYSDMNFTMTVNVCEGMPQIKGYYFIYDKTIVLNFNPKQYYNFSGEDDTKYLLEIITNKKLKFINSSGAGCGPDANTFFIKK